MTPNEILSSASAVDSVVHIIQVALTPVFLLSGIASLLSVFSGRLARVADKVDLAMEKLDTADPDTAARLRRRLVYLRRRSHLLDAAVVLGAVAGGATCVAALMLFVGSLREGVGGSLLLTAFGLALTCIVLALAAYLTEMLIASRGIRERVDEPNSPRVASAG